MSLVIKPVSLLIPVTGIIPLPPGAGTLAHVDAGIVVIPVYHMACPSHISQMIGYGSASLHVNSI